MNTGKAKEPAFLKFDEKLCIGCYEGVRACPTRAIRVRTGKPVFKEHLCIGCGECIRVCPAGAMKAATSKPEPDPNEISVAIVSPVLYSQFPGASSEDVLSAVRRTGFGYAVDGSYFYEVYQWVAEEFVVRNKKSEKIPTPLISPVCPAVARLIAIEFPSLIPRVLPVMRPVELMVREIREQIAKKHAGGNEPLVIHYINPCPTKQDIVFPSSRKKKPFAEKILGINDIYPELVRHIEEIMGEKKAVSRFEQDILSYEVSGNSPIWGVSGGEIIGMNIDRTLAVSGLKETIAYLEKIEMGLFRDIDYIEFRTCPEGCIGGILTGTDKYLAKNAVYKAVLKKKFKKRINRKEIRKRYNAGLFHSKSTTDKLAGMSGVRKELMSIRRMKEVEILLARIRGRNCSACGSPDCRSFAEDVVRGEASLNECLMLRAREHGETEQKNDRERTC